MLLKKLAAINIISVLLTGQVLPPKC